MKLFTKLAVRGFEAFFQVTAGPVAHYSSPWPFPDQSVVMVKSTKIQQRNLKCFYLQKNCQQKLLTTYEVNQYYIRAVQSLNFKLKVRPIYPIIFRKLKIGVKRIGVPKI